MNTYLLTIDLRSDTTFGRGDGVAGLLDQEVEHDADGFPYLRGRTLKGLLSEECDNIVAMLPPGAINWNTALIRLFGEAGSTSKTAARWFFADAQLPDDLRYAIKVQLDAERRKIAPALTPQDILNSLTTMRRQTAMDAAKGTPDTGSLRSMRVLMRGLSFTSRCELHDDPSEPELMLLATGCLALRHIGAGRNRGRGWAQCTLRDLHGNDLTAKYFTRFAGEAA